MTARQLILNGRFFQRPVTGVERLAIELCRGLRALLAELDPGTSFEVAVPRGTSVDATALTPADTVPPVVHAIGRLDGHAWEQVELARYRSGAWLLNLCNTAPIARRRQIIVICDAQFILHPESYSRAFRWWYRVSLSLASRRAAAVFTISAFSRDQLERHHVVPRGKAHILRLGIDHLDDVDPDHGVIARHALGERPYILATGSLARHKNLALLIEAFASARLGNVDLVIAGGGNARVFGEAGFPAADNVHFLGRVSDGELRALYGGALAFACPSLSEGFGFTPLEAMSTGCPVIATTGGAVPEVCGDAALYADPRDRAAWSNALRLMVDDGDLRATLRAKGLDHVARFRWREAAGQVLTVLARLDGRDHLAERIGAVTAR